MYNASMYRIILQFLHNQTDKRDVDMPHAGTKPFIP